MNADLLGGQFRVLFNGHSFVGVLSHDVFKHLLLSEQLALLVVAQKPKTGRVMVVVVSDGQVVRSKLLNCILMDQVFIPILHNVIATFKAVVTIIIRLHHLVHVDDLFFLVILLFWVIHHLGHVVNVYHIIYFTLFSPFDLSFNPSVFNFDFMHALGR